MGGNYQLVASRQCTPQGTLPTMPSMQVHMQQLLNLHTCNSQLHQCNNQRMAMLAGNKAHLPSQEPVKAAHDDTTNDNNVVGNRDPFCSCQRKCVVARVPSWRLSCCLLT